MSWAVYDDDGQEIREDNKPLRLLILDGHLQMVAARAQRRHFQRAWKAGRLRFREQYGDHIRWVWIEFLFAVAIIIATSVLIIVAVESTNYEMVLASIMLAFLGSVFAWLLLKLCLRPLLIPSVMKGQFDGQSFAAWLRDGSEAMFDLSRLSSLRIDVAERIYFGCNGDKNVWLTEMPRTKLALQVVRDDVLPAQANFETRRADRIIVGIGVLDLAMGASVVWLGFLGLLPMEWRWGWITAFLAVHGTITLLLPRLISFMHERRQRRFWRKRAKQRSHDYQ